MTEGIIAVMVLGTIFFGIAAVLASLFWGIRLVRGPSPRNPRAEEEEARIVQELYKGLSAMDKRIEALETILLEPHEQQEFQSRKDPTHDPL